jgi:peptidoglycan hydrolase-like protein with peptidoglycan-binding domain
MKRRAFLTTLPAALLLSSGALRAAGTPLQAAFDGFSDSARREVQSRLQAAGFYQGTIDGRYGPGTEAALRETAAFIDYNSYGKVKPDIGSDDGARAYLRALADGTHDKWLWGEGGEGD